MTSRARCSPYLVLGVGFGTSAATANRAFARRLRQLDGLPLTQEDLNWAQSQFKRPEDLRTSVEHLRLPSGSASRTPPTVGLFRPAPEGAAEPTPGGEPVADDPALVRARAALIRMVMAEALQKSTLRTTYDPYGVVT
jgi:hypothetical protein